MQRFHFPIVIIDEDYRSENTSGLGIRALAQAIEKEGFECGIKLKNITDIKEGDHLEFFEVKEVARTL